MSVPKSLGKWTDGRVNVVTVGADIFSIVKYASQSSTVTVFNG